MHAVGGKPVFLALNKKKEAYSPPLSFCVRCQEKYFMIS